MMEAVMEFQWDSLPEVDGRDHTESQRAAIAPCCPAGSRTDGTLTSAHTTVCVRSFDIFLYLIPWMLLSG